MCSIYAAFLEIEMELELNCELRLMDWQHICCISGDISGSGSGSESELRLLDLQHILGRSARICCGAQ